MSEIRCTSKDSTLAVVSGWACETRRLKDGRRQIFAIALPGDVIELKQRLAEKTALALTMVELIEFEALAGADPAAEWDRASLLHQAAQRREAFLLDHFMRVGQLSARERVAHFFLELHERLEAIGLVNAGAFAFPLTQEMLADALGLSLGHVKRTLHQFARDELLTVSAGRARISDPERLAEVAG